MQTCCLIFTLCVVICFVLQEVVDELAEDILSKLPADFDIPMVIDKYPVMYEESMNTVLRQEVIRFNRQLQLVQFHRYTSILENTNLNYH